MILVWRNI